MRGAVNVLFRRRQLLGSQRLEGGVPGEAQSTGAWTPRGPPSSAGCGPPRKIQGEEEKEPQWTEFKELLVPRDLSLWQIFHGGGPGLPVPSVRRPQQSAPVKGSEEHGSCAPRVSPQCQPVMPRPSLTSHWGGVFGEKGGKSTPQNTCDHPDRKAGRGDHSSSVQCFWVCCPHPGRK